MFIKRDLQSRIQTGAEQMPVIAIIGPRQSGKSTLVKQLFPHHHYLDMQDAQLFEFADDDPKGFLNSYKNDQGIIIDEAQYAPKLFAQIKVEADKNPKPGYYILSGSQNFLLHEKISESLSGRVFFYTLLPLSIKELVNVKLLHNDITEQLYAGFYPKLYQQKINIHDYYANYVSTYVERDIRTIRNIENIITFKRFMQLCALRIGTPLNLADLCAKSGITVTTGNSWLSLLQASFVVFLLPPYHNNLGKRITKSPKLYFYDVGLALALLGISKESLVEQRDIYGSLFENMVIVDIIKNFNATSYTPAFTFFRDSNKNEVDLVIEIAGKTIPIEIKSSETINKKFFDTILWFSQELKHPVKPMLIYRGTQTQNRTESLVLGWKSLSKIMQAYNLDE